MQTTDFALFHPCQMGVLEVKLKVLVSTPAGPPQETPMLRSTFIKTVACTDGYHGGMCHEIRHMIDADFLRSSGYDMDRVEAAVPEVLSMKGKGMEGSECLGMCGPLHLQYRLFENAPAPAWWVDARATSSSPPSASSASSAIDSAAPAASPSEPPPTQPSARRISTIVDITLANVLVVQALPVPLLISLRGLATPGASSSGSGGSSAASSGVRAAAGGAAPAPVAVAVAFPSVEPVATPAATAEDLERDRLLCRVLNAQLNSHEILRRELVPESYWGHPFWRPSPGACLSLQYLGCPPGAELAERRAYLLAEKSRLHLGGTHPYNDNDNYNHNHTHTHEGSGGSGGGGGADSHHHRLHQQQQQLDSIAVRTCAVCDKTADLQKCGRCWSSVYCSVAHQRQDWGRHRRHCCPPAPAPS